MTFTKRPSIRELHQAMLMYGPMKNPPAFMDKVPRAPRTKPNSSEETDYLHILLKTAKEYYERGLKGVWLHRNNNGVGRAMNSERVIRFGMGTGTSDALGYSRVTVTQAMVGQCVAIFTAVEAKRSGEKPTAEQQAFIDQILRDGGIARYATPSDNVHDVIKSLQDRRE